MLNGIGGDRPARSFFGTRATPRSCSGTFLYFASPLSQLSIPGDLIRVRHRPRLWEILRQGTPSAPALFCTLITLDPRTDTNELGHITQCATEDPLCASPHNGS